MKISLDIDRYNSIETTNESLLIIVTIEMIKDFLSNELSDEILFEDKHHEQKIDQH